MSETTSPAMFLGKILNMLGAAKKEKKNIEPTQNEIDIRYINFNMI